MKHLVVAVGLCALLVHPHALAEVAGDPLAWLGRIAAAGQRLNYSGTFIYQSGRNFETSRISHVADASGEYERLEVLDGSPREVIRNNSEVRCVLPEQKTVIIDRPGGRRAFPARLPSSFSGLAENYRIRKGEVSRVAGLDTQLIILEPKDDLRYGHMLWAEVQTGLLLKARMVDERGDVIEQFAFSNVKIGDVIEPAALKSRFTKGPEWRVINAHGIEVRREESRWLMNAPLPGFVLQSIVRRPLGRDRGEAVQMVYGDGMASISVFVEPAGSDSARAGIGPLATGAINIYKRRVNGYLITALGEVPLKAVQRVGDGIEPVVQ